MSDNKLLENKEPGGQHRWNQLNTMIYFSQLSISMEYYNLKDFSHSYVHRHDRNVFIV